MERSEPEPTFWVRDIPIYGDVILAPMAGYADVPHRAICRAYGSCMNYTEFVSVDELLGNYHRAWSLLDYTEEDHPMVFQIFGNDAQMILDAAQRIEEKGPDIIDINMGCSTRRVSGRGAGVGMMPQPDLIAQTFSLLTKHLTVPVTGKIRLGWDGNENYLEIARILEDNGASLIAMHGRTKEQKYKGQANWDALAELKQAVTVPVIGNGDIKKAADVDAMLNHTNCDAVMIGRSAIGNPWIFARQDRDQLPFHEITRAIRLHLNAMLAYHGPRGLILFRKHLKHYLKDLPPTDDICSKMIVARTTAEFESLLATLEVEFGTYLIRDLTQSETNFLKEAVLTHYGMT
ncbi:MAG: tRNA dihydrouridine synthase DusB [Candidatus Promineifilaceae bacterium]